MDIKYSLLHVSDPPEKWIKQTKKFLLVTKYKREVEIAAQSQLIPNPCLVLSHYSCQHTAVYPHMIQFQRGRIQPKKNLEEVVTDCEISLLYLSIIYLWFLHLHDIYGTTEVKKIQTEAFGTTRLSLTWLYPVMLMSDPGPHVTSFLNLL